MYIRSLLGSFSSRLLDLRAISETLSQVMPGGARETASDGGLSLGLKLLQKHAVKLDNDQTIASELRKSQSPRSTTRTFFRKSLPLSPQPRNFHGSRIWVRTHVFLNLRMSIRRRQSVVRIFFSSCKLMVRLTGRLLK
jgi:hypothetical protein